MEPRRARREAGTGLTSGGTKQGRTKRDERGVATDDWIFPGRAAARSGYVAAGACAVRTVRRDGATCPGLACEAGAHHRAHLAGWRHRHRHAGAGQPRGRCTGTVRGRREPPGCRADPGHRVRRACPCGWLHPADGGQRDRAEPGAGEAATLRHPARLRAGHARRVPAARADRAPEPAGEIGEGSGGAGEGQTRRPDLRFRWQRQHRASLGRAVPRPRESEYGACAVQGSASCCDRRDDR